MTTTTLASIDNKRTKVERLREDKFCVFFCLGFALWWVLFLILLSSLKSLFISKNLVIIFKLSSI
jgi:hypothetical protein